MTICVYGGAGNDVAQNYLQASFAAGQAVGEAGGTLLYGGGVTGCMAAAARGCLSVGGHVVAIVVDSMEGLEEVLSPDVEVVHSATLTERKEKMQARSDAYLVLPGGTGTLDEFFTTLTNKECGFLRGDILLLNSDGYYDALLRWLDAGTEAGFVRERARAAFAVCRDAKELKRCLTK